MSSLWYVWHLWKIRCTQGIIRQILQEWLRKNSWKKSVHALMNWYMCSIIHWTVHCSRRLRKQECIWLLRMKILQKNRKLLWIVTLKMMYIRCWRLWQWTLPDHSHWSEIRLWILVRWFQRKIKRINLAGRTKLKRKNSFLQQSRCRQCFREWFRSHRKRMEILR